MRKIKSGASALAIASLAAWSLATVSPAQAEQHLTVQSQVQHYVECLIWLITDPVKHKEFCSPGFYVPPPDLNHTPGAPVETPPPKPKPECPVYAALQDWSSPGRLYQVVTIECPPPPECDVAYRDGSGQAYLLPVFEGCPSSYRLVDHRLDILI